MAISQADLRAAANRSFGSPPQFKRYGQKSAFLCHSHHDHQLAMGLQVALREQGLDLYIDWQDSTMPTTPNKETASKLRQRMVECDLFLFLATENSMNSRWCPWELGYADGRKQSNWITVVPTSDGYTTHGSEYLGLYRHIDKRNWGGYEVFAPGASYGSPLNTI